MVARSPKILAPSSAHAAVHPVDADQIRRDGERGYWYNGEFYIDTVLPEAGVGPEGSFTQRLTSRKFLLALAGTLTTIAAFLTGQIDGVALISGVGGLIATYNAAEGYADAHRATA